MKSETVEIDGKTWTVTKLPRAGRRAMRRSAGKHNTVENHVARQEHRPITKHCQAG